MNVRYGPSAPLLENRPCIMCNYSSQSLRTFPCGCQYPIHDPCITHFRRIGGVCPRCHQVWVPVDIDGHTDTTYGVNPVHKEWILEHHPMTGRNVTCGCFPTDTHRSRCLLTVGCLFILLFGGLCIYLLLKLEQST